MKLSKKAVIEIIAGFLFECFLLTQTLSGGALAVQVVLCVVFFGVFACLYIQNPWPEKTSGKGQALVLQILFNIIIIMALLRAPDYSPALGAFAVVPANLALLANYLAGFYARKKPADLPEV